MSQSPSAPSLIDLGWPESAVRRLKESAVTDAGQVVGIGAVTGGVQSLSEQTGLEVAQIEELLTRTRAALPPADREEFSRPTDTSNRGLGALPPREE